MNHLNGGDMRDERGRFPLAGQTGVIRAIGDSMGGCEDTMTCMERQQGAEIIRVVQSRAAADPQANQRHQQRCRPK